MSEESQNSQLFSMDVESIRILLKESKQQLAMAEEYLQYYLDQEIVSGMLICLLCEYYACNFTLVKEVASCLEYNALVEREDKKELMLTSHNIKILESTAFARYLLVKQLLEYNISTYMN